MSSGAYTLKLSRTLYNDTFRAQLLDENQQVIGHLRIVPGVPLDRRRRAQRSGLSFGHCR
jgi:hypothetical protein